MERADRYVVSIDESGKYCAPGTPYQCCCTHSRALAVSRVTHPLEVVHIPLITDLKGVYI